METSTIQEAEHNKVLQYITSLMEKFSEMQDGEIEARIGDYNNQKSSVDKTIFEILMRNVERGCPNESPWVEFHDYFYQHDTNNVRTRVKFDTNNMRLSSESTVKQLIGSKTFSSRESDLCMRVKLSREIDYEKNAPAFVDPIRVCITRRRSFVFPDTAHPVWSFDFSKVASGNNRLEAEEHFTNDHIEHHIECELISVDYCKKDYEHAGASMLYKMENLTGCTFK